MSCKLVLQRRIIYALKVDVETQKVDVETRVMASCLVRFSSCQCLCQLAASKRT